MAMEETRLGQLKTRSRASTNKTRTKRATLATNCRSNNNAQAAQQVDPKAEDWAAKNTLVWH